MGNTVNIVQEHVGEQLPQVEFHPDQNGDKTRKSQTVAKISLADHHLEKENSAHNDHQFLNGREATHIRKRNGTVSNSFFHLVKPDSIFLHLIAKHPLAQAKALGCLGLYAMMLMKGLDDSVPLDFLKDLGQTLLPGRD